MIKIARSEVVEAIRYTDQQHGKGSAREIRHQLHNMAEAKTPRTQLEAKVNAGLKRKHVGGVFAIFKKGE